MKVIAFLLGFVLLTIFCKAQKLVIEVGQSTFQEKLASKELRRFIFLRTGVLSEISDSGESSKSHANIILGVKNQPHLQPYLNDTNISERIAVLEPQQYFIKTVHSAKGKVLLIVGGDPIGLLYGAYTFIEQLGVRFYLEGDVVPDKKIAWEIPEIDETGKPLFELRGLNPWGSHPFGIDQWNADDYKAIIGQMAKMKMNFIGIHGYLTDPYDEPTVWVGERKDINIDGTVKTAYPARYYNTLWKGIWGPILPKKTSEYPFGASMLFENDTWGPESMDGFCPTPYQHNDQKELFNRVGKQFHDAFGFAKLVGVKTCLGTEAPLQKFVPIDVKARIENGGKNNLDSSAIAELYKGIFERIKRTHPLDYYWIWTPEDWTWRGNSIDDMQQTVEDIHIASQALKDVDAPFKLATSGWVLGPVANRAAFDAVISKDIPMGALSQNFGHSSIDPAFKIIRNREKWAIPWLESDKFHGLSAVQLFAGRTMFDAVVAKEFDCSGLMGLLWRTREMGPNVSALAKAGWKSLAAPKFDSVAYTNDIYSEAQKLSDRSLPVLEFYKDFALANFGSEVSEPIAGIFSSIDGKVPISVKTECPAGTLFPDSISWEIVSRQFDFVEKMEKYRSKVKGAGNLERFDFWLNSFRYHKNLAKVSCTLGAFETAIKKAEMKRGFEVKRDDAIAEALPVYIELIQEYEELATLCLNSVSTNSGIATIVNLFQNKSFWEMAIETPGKRLSDLLAEPLPPEAIPTSEYKGKNRLFMTAVRTSIQNGESLAIKVNLLSNSKPEKITFFWRTLGAKEYVKIPLENRSRGICTTTLDTNKLNGNDFEYFVEAEFYDGTKVVYPATAREINNSVIVLP